MTATAEFPREFWPDTPPAFDDNAVRTVPQKTEPVVTEKNAASLARRSAFDCAEALYRFGKILDEIGQIECFGRYRRLHSFCQAELGLKGSEARWLITLSRGLAPIVADPKLLEKDDGRYLRLLATTVANGALGTSKIEECLKVRSAPKSRRR